MVILEEKLHPKIAPAATISQIQQHFFLNQKEVNVYKGVFYSHGQKRQTEHIPEKAPQWYRITDTNRCNRLRGYIGQYHTEVEHVVFAHSLC